MKKFLLTTTLISTALIGSAMAQGMNKSQIEAIIKDYIQNNPEVILDSVEEYGRAQQEVSQADRQKAVDENIGWVMNNDTLPVAGNADGDVTVVEFYDYNCGYCKKAMADVTTLIEEDKNVKVVFVEMPILGRTSELAARWALASEAQGAFLPYHIALMNNRGPITEDTLEKIAKNNNLDVAEMRKYANSDKVTAMIAEKSAKASEMGISGTPAFIIDGQLYGGYIGLDAMKEAVKEAREG